MKNLLSSIFLLLVLITLLFSLSNKYYGSYTEQSFKAYLKNYSAINAEDNFTVNLLNYRNTILGATAKFSINSKVSIGSIDDLYFEVSLLNGPVFITKTGISTGRTRWLVSLDETSLGEKERNYINSVFLKSVPKLLIRIDFNEKSYYSSTFETNIGVANLQGIYDIKTVSNEGVIVMNDFHYKFPSNKVSSKEVSITYKQGNKRAGVDKLTTIDIHSEKLQLKNKGIKEPIEVDFLMKTNLRQAKASLAGDSNIKIKQNSENLIPFDFMSLNFIFKGISTNGFLRFNEAKADLANLQQQVKWSLEENGELPEGQDQIWQHYDVMEENIKRIKSKLVKEIFNDDSYMQLSAESTNKSGKSQLKADLKITDESLQETIKKEGGGFISLFSILTGKADVVLDKDLLSYMNHSFPVLRSKFKLVLKESKLLMQ